MDAPPPCSPKRRREEETGGESSSSGDGDKNAEGCAIKAPRLSEEGIESSVPMAPPSKPMGRDARGRGSLDEVGGRRLLLLTPARSVGRRSGREMPGEGRCRTGPCDREAEEEEAEGGTPALVDARETGRVDDICATSASSPSTGCCCFSSETARRACDRSGERRGDDEERPVPARCGEGGVGRMAAGSGDQPATDAAGSDAVMPPPAASLLRDDRCHCTLKAGGIASGAGHGVY